MLTKKPIFRIDYLATNGLVADFLEFDDINLFRKKVEEETNYGVPFNIVAYVDKDGNANSANWIKELDPPPKGFKTEVYKEEEFSIIKIGDRLDILSERTPGSRPKRKYAILVSLIKKSNILCVYDDFIITSDGDKLVCYTNIEEFPTVFVKEVKRISYDDYKNKTSEDLINACTEDYSYSGELDDCSAYCFWKAITVKDLLDDDDVEYEDFKEAVENIGCWDNVNDEEVIRDYIIEQIRNDICVSHILAVIENEESITGDYQIWLGNSMETPIPINCKKDLAVALDLEDDDAIPNH